MANPAQRDSDPAAGTSAAGGRGLQTDSDAAQNKKLVRRVLMAGLASLLLAVVALMVINMVDAKSPKPLWTIADLPQPPPDKANGWAHLQQYPKLFDGLMRDKTSKAVDTTLKSATSHGALAGVLAPARAEAATLTNATRECRAAFALPRFFDACPIRIEARCHVLVIVRCHQLLGYHLLEAAAAERWSQAVELNDQLLRQNLDLASSAHSIVGQHVALSGLLAAMDLAAALGRYSNAATVAPLVERLAEVKAPRLRLELLSIGEYLFFSRAVTEISKPDSNVAVSDWCVSHKLLCKSSLLDRGATLAGLNELFAPIKKSNKPADLGARFFAKGAGWWLHNAAGKLILDNLQGARGIYGRIADKRDKVLKMAAEVRSKLPR